ncbi:DAD3 [Candida jiufengensis]|uniref:DAD3 n=1 Tax=Candida jiufengensis TaxID=497108 RepID=UPI0022241CEA|nr:DAD3 [Candida jiufengensis]KAI5954455.1 DAD3 [Candida jiufengensis]
MSPAIDTTTSTNNSNTRKQRNDIDYSKIPSLSELEASILTEYQILNNTLIKINQQLKNLTTTKPIQNGKDVKSQQLSESVILIENLRKLETKISFIYTFFKGAVYTLYANEGEGEEELTEETSIYDNTNDNEQEENQEDDEEEEEYNNDELNFKKPKRSQRDKQDDEYEKGANELSSISDS